MSDTTFRDTVAGYFKARPGVWIDSLRFEHIGGRCAWRTRISECRTQLGMTIENRVSRQTDHEGKQWTISKYRYVPAEGGQADPLVTQGHNLNDVSTPGSLF